MKLSDKVLNLLLFDQQENRPLLDENNLPYIMTVYDHLDPLKRKIYVDPYQSVKSTLKKIQESLKEKDWFDLVFMRMTCGPDDCQDGRYLATLKDHTGALSVKERYGALDWKLDAFADQVDKENQWSAWALCALQNIMAYTREGAEVIITRVNLLQDLFDHYVDRYQKEPDESLLLKAANILSWNIFLHQNDEMACLVMDWNSHKPMYKMPYEL